MPAGMTRTTALSVALLVSTVFTGFMLSAHAAVRTAERPAAVSAPQGSCEDAPATPGYWQSWAAATAQ
jgi:hypothetical protein